MEETLMAGGERERVLDVRRGFQSLMGEQYSGVVERLTGRKVVAFLSQTHVDPDITLEVFFLEQPLAGFGATEIFDAPRIEAGPGAGD